MYPILFKIGPITIYSYGIFVALAFCISSYLIIKESKNYNIPKDIIWDLLLYILISGIIGARLFHVLLNLEYYKNAPIEILMLPKGGLAIHGAIIAAIITAALFLFKKKIPLWVTGDLIMLYLPLGQAIGRIGCFFNGCCYGKPSTSFLSVTFPGHLYARNIVQLYLAIALLVTFFTLKYVIAKKKRFDGEILLGYFIIYTPLRFLVDFFRGDLQPVLFNLTVTQIVGATFFIVALTIYYVRRRGVRT